MLRKVKQNVNKRKRAPMIQHRRRQIQEIVRKEGVAHVDELAKRFGVSQVTIRTDLTKLEKAGELVRDRGGALAPEQPQKVTQLLGIAQRGAINREAKKRIGKLAAGLVAPGDTIILDAGTTVVEMAPYLSGVAHLTVVTTALNVALEVGAVTDARVLLLGGNLSREASSTVGPLTEQSLGELTVQKVFLGTQALDLESGLTDTTHEIAEVKRAMIRSAREVYLLCDSAKWGTVGFIKVAPLSAVQTVVSDRKLPTAAQKALAGLGVRVLLG
jgi:DeoR/GlpR family transcriptional regulator of sugar metabolism